jgi:hypothetical protein
MQPKVGMGAYGALYADFTRTSSVVDRSWAQKRRLLQEGALADVSGAESDPRPLNDWF